MAKNTSVTATDAAENRGLAKKRTSRIGWSVWRSHSVNAVNSTTAATKQPTMSGSLQPRVGPSMMPKSSVTSPTVDNAVPSTSRDGFVGSFEFGTIQRTPTMATMISGTFTRKIEPHQKCSSR